MKIELLNKIRCPKCKNNSFSTMKRQFSDENIIEGAIKCNKCSGAYDIDKGILKFDINNQELRREILQWEIFANSEGWLELNEMYLESLPSGGSNILMQNDTIVWKYHAFNFFNMLEKLNIKNKAILDLGAGRCWSSKWISLKGGDVIAFDALPHPTIGLGASNVFFRNHNIYFERISGDFNEFPFMDGVFDVVFSTGSLHHSVNIKQTLNEISRVLKSNGIMVLINEPFASIFRIKEKIKMNGAQNGINEHMCRTAKLLSILRANKLKISLINESPNVYDQQSPYYQGIFASIINKTNFGKLLYLIIRGGVLNCIVKKV